MGTLTQGVWCVHVLSMLPPRRPIGVFEFEKFAGGSKTILEAVVAATEKGATSIIGN